MADDKYQEAERYARGRMDSIREAVSEYSADPDSTVVQDFPLDVEVLGNRHRDKYIVTVLLGTGGPHDELRFTVTDGSTDRVDYWYADWGYGTFVTLTRAESDTAEAFLDALMDVSDLSGHLDIR